MYIDKDELKEKIIETYGVDENDACDMRGGCFVNGTWLSIADIFELIDDCDTYEA